MDFSTLTDDQLVELLRAASQDAFGRTRAVWAAAQAAMLSEAEKAQIAGDSARREAERLRQEQAARIAQDAAEEVRRQAGQTEQQQADAKQKKQWGMQKTLGQMVVDVLGAGWTLTVWLKEGEKRVYLDRQEGRQKTGRAEYFVTGNSYNAPKTLKCVEGVPASAESLVKLIAQRAAREWNSAKMNCDKAAASGVAAIGTVPDGWDAAWETRRSAEAVAERNREESLQKASLLDILGRPLVYVKPNVPINGKLCPLGVMRVKDWKGRHELYVYKMEALYGPDYRCGDKSHPPIAFRVPQGSYASSALLVAHREARGEMTQLAELFSEGEIAVLFDPEACSPLTYDAVQDALKSQVTA